MRTYYTYIMSGHRKCLYIGVTNNLLRRVYEHKEKRNPSSFTARYNIKQLVYFEAHQSIEAAIEREKQLKRWSRSKKIWLIKKFNPAWRDLANGLL